MRSASHWRTYGWFFLAAAAGRLGILFLLRDQWGWQPPYHLVFLQPGDSYDPIAQEYMVRQMPLYPAFLKLIRDSGLALYVAAPALQTLFQVAAIALLARQLARRVFPGRLLAAAGASFVLGFDPWLADTAIIMQPASVTATLFILLVERTLRFCSETIETSRPPAWWKVAATSGALAAAGAYFRADFASYSVLPPLAVTVCICFAPTARIGRSVSFGSVSLLASVGLVILLLLPRSVYLQPHTGTMLLTTNAGGCALWAGLGELRNPWGIPNPEDGDEPIEQFARAHGYASSYGSARSSVFFKNLFWNHVREQPTILAKLLVVRIHRMLFGWPPQSITFVGDYVLRPEIGALGARLSSEGWLRVMFSRDLGWLLRQVGLRYVGTALIWLTLAAACLFLVRFRVESPLLAVPALAYAVGVGVFLAVHWSYRYGQQFYWLGYLAVLFIVARATLPSPRRVSSPGRRH